MASARFFTRSGGVFPPERGVALPVVFVFHGPVSPDRLTQLGGSAFFFFQAGDEVACFAFEFVAPVFLPFPDDPHELFRAGKTADLFVNVDPRHSTTLGAPVVFFPLADPFVGDVGEFFLRPFVEGGLVVF